MTNIKKAIVILLALLIVIGSFPAFALGASGQPVFGAFANDKDNKTKNRYEVTTNTSGQTVVSYSKMTSWDGVTATVSGYTSEYTRLCITAKFTGTEQFDVEAKAASNSDGREILWYEIKTGYIEGEKATKVTKNPDGSYTFDITIPKKYSDINSKGIVAVKLFLDPEKSVSGTRSMTIIDIGFRKAGEPIETGNETQYGVSLNPTEISFSNATFGYGSQTAKTVTITNTGNVATGSLGITLSETNFGSFNLSTTQTSLSVGGTGTFTVTPKTGLAVGTYKATVTVSNSNVVAKTVNVSFTVSKANGASVSAPISQKVTENSITVNAVTAPPNGQSVEYAINNSTTAPSSGWGTSLIFNGLKANTTYYVYARSAANNNYNAGAAARSAAIKTLPAVIWPTSITVSPTSPTLDVGATRQLTATVKPDNATDKSVKWSSSNNAVATVSASGLVTAVAPGSATITAETVNGLKATCVVTVNAIPPTSITVSPTSATLDVGATRQLTATVLPSNATDKSVKWSSSNNAIATVSASGLVTAVAPGSATITAETVNGLKATCAVTVTVNKRPGAPVGAPTLQTVTENSITVNAVTAPSSGQSVEYAINTSTTAPSSGWGTSRTFNGLSANTTYYVYARSAANNNYNAGAAVSVEIKTLEGNIYYVVKTGSNTTGNGSSANPWGTIQFGINKLKAGDTLIIREGTYNEKLTVGVSGTASNYIIIKGEEGKRVIVDGTGVSGNSNNNSMGCNAMITLKNQSYVRIENLEFCNNLPSSSFNAGIYVEATDSSSSVGIQLINNKVYYINRTATNTNTDNGKDGHGIAVYGKGTATNGSVRDILIEGNEVSYCKLGWSESVVVNGNVVGWQIINNYIHDNDNIGIDAIGGEGKPSGQLDRARNGLIAGNAVVGISARGNRAYGNDLCAPGIYVDGGYSITIKDNYVGECDFGMSIGTEHKSDLGVTNDYWPDDIYIQNNVVCGSRHAAILLGSMYGAKKITLEKNTIYQAAPSPDGWNNGCITVDADDGERPPTTAGPGPFELISNIIISGKSTLDYVEYQDKNVKPSFSNNIYYGGPSSTPSGDNNGEIVKTLPVAKLPIGDSRAMANRWWFVRNADITAGADEQLFFVNKWQIGWWGNY